MLLKSALLAAPLAFAALAATRTDTAHVPNARAIEVVRLQAHFDSVVGELSAAPTIRLNDGQRARRAILVTELQRYRDAGAFPRNYDFAEPTPYFVDRKTGIVCAVANLLVVSGRSDMVERVRATNNNVRVAQLSADTAFRAWLDSTGLTLAEAARIQVPYDGSGSWEGPLRLDAAPRTNTGYVVSASVATSVAVGAAMWNATLNSPGRSELASALGIASGAVAVGMGIAGPSTSTAPTAMRVIAAGSGAVSMWLGGRGLVRYNFLKKREAAARRAVVAPVLVSEGAPAAGMSVSIRF